MLERSKRIIFTVTNDLSYDQRMIRHCRILQSAGYEVLLTGRIKSNSIELKDEPFKQKRLNCIFDKGKLFYLEYNLRLFFFLLKQRSDIIVSVDLDTLLSCTLAAIFKRSHLVFDAHEYFTEVPELIGRDLSRRVWDYLGKVCMNRIDKAYTVGQVLAALFSDIYQIPFQCVMNVPEFSEKPELDLNHEPAERIILYQGALNEGRGLEQFIEAMSELDAHLWIAGEGDLSEYLRQMVTNRGLENKVKFLGYVTPKQLPELTSKAWLGVNILEPKGLSYYYSLANKFFDYIHAGIPQICAPFPEYKAINNKFEVAVLTECRSAEIVTAVNHLILDRELYGKLQLNCRKAAEVYNLQAESEKLLKIYSELS